MPRKKRTRVQLDRINAKDRARRKTDPEWVARRYASCKAWHVREKAAGRPRVRSDYDYEHHLRTTCGFSIAKKEELFRAQQCRCPICGVATKPVDGWVVDHNHLTKKVRGVLCQRCNKGLGCFRDSAATMRAGADYLEQHP